MKETPETKVCTKCKTVKPLSSYGTTKSTQTGKVYSKNICYDCKNKARREKYATDDEHKKRLQNYRRNYYKENKDKVRAYDQKYRLKPEVKKQRTLRNKLRNKTETYKVKRQEYQRKYKQANKEKVRKYQREYNQANKEKRQEYRQANKEKIRERNREYHQSNQKRRREYQRKYYQANKEKIRERNREYDRANSMHRVSKNLKWAIWNCLNGGKSFEHWEDVVGWTIDDFRKHIEPLFQPGMTWENHGEWHIDHIIPQSAFNIKTKHDIDFKRCWALSNLQPLWAKENMSKHAKLEKPFQPSLALPI